MRGQYKGYSYALNCHHLEKDQGIPFQLAVQTLLSVLGLGTSSERGYSLRLLCYTNVCTITAPPNAHVSPPGWFQLFVLDGPTPSHSTWVRIGGDPAELGNWPPFDDFTRPGI